MAHVLSSTRHARPVTPPDTRTLPKLAGSLAQDYNPRREAFEVGRELAAIGIGREILTEEAQTHPDVADLLQGHQQGLSEMGRRANGHERVIEDPHQRKVAWLRYSAWLRGRAFDPVGVTADFLRQIDTGFCPILRQPLTYAAHRDTDSSVDRLDNDLGYVRGNLAIISHLANKARGAKDPLSMGNLALALMEEDASRRAANPDTEPLRYKGLTATQWARFATFTAAAAPLPMPIEAQLLWPLNCNPPGLVALNAPWAVKMALTRAAVGLLPAKPLLATFKSKRGVNLATRWMNDLYRTYGGLVAERHIPRVSPVAGAPAREIRQQLQWALDDAWATPLCAANWRQLVPHLEFKDLVKASNGAGTRDVTPEEEAHLRQAGAAHNRGFVARVVQQRAATWVH